MWSHPGLSGGGGAVAICITIMFFEKYSAKCTTLRYIALWNWFLLIYFFRHKKIQIFTILTYSILISYLPTEIILNINLRIVFSWNQWFYVNSFWIQDIKRCIRNVPNVYKNIDIYRFSPFYIAILLYISIFSFIYRCIVSST